MSWRCFFGFHKRTIRLDGISTFYARCGRCEKPLKPPTLAELFDRGFTGDLPPGEER